MLGKGLKAQYESDYQVSDAEKESFDAFYDSNGSSGSVLQQGCIRETLKALRVKMIALENEELKEAILKSNKTHEEAIAFLELDMKPDETPCTPNRRGDEERSKTVS